MSREQWIARAGGLRAAVEYEETCLRVGREFLPAHVLAVLDGGEPTPEYWTWLTDSLDQAEAEGEVRS